jgi:hypothetical protein
MSFNLNRAATSMASGAHKQVATVTIREAVQIDDRFARIIATASSAATPEQIAEGIKQQFQGAVAIPGSFVSLASSKAMNVFEGIVGVVAQRIVLTDENRGNFKAIAANMFMSNDESESLWALRTTATGQVLVKAADNDADVAVMKQLMACASTDHNAFEHRDIGAENAQVRASVEGGDLITYVSQTSADLQMGIATASIENEDGSDAHMLAVVRPNGQAETINREMIVVAGTYEDSEEDIKEAQTATAGAMDVERFNSYYARVFARRPAYFEEFMKRVRSYVFM